MANIPFFKFWDPTNSTGMVNQLIALLNSAISNAGVSSLTVTDGSHTVNGTTGITVSGGTVSGATPNATITVAGGGSGLTVGTTTITGGASGNVEFNNGGVLGEKAVTGSGSVVLATSPSLTSPALDTPSSVTLTNATGLPLATGVTGNLPVTNLNSGSSASSSTFWRGDGTWSTPAGGGGSGAAGGINMVTTYGLVGDGVTNNDTAMQTYELASPSLTKSFPATVTFTQGGGNAAVVHWAFHYLEVNDVVSFTSTGSLPTGITANTLYYVISPNMIGGASGQFEISTSNVFYAVGAGVNISGSHPEGSPVTISNVGSGTISIVVHNQETLVLTLPPGCYHFGVYHSFGAGLRRIKVYGDGAVVDNLSPTAINTDIIGFTTFNIGLNSNETWALINTVHVGDSALTLQTIGQAALFYPNQWICIMCLDLMQGVLGPPNNHYFEYAQIQTINAGTGVISLYGKIHETYRQGYPTWNAGIGSISSGGPATIYGMPFFWDNEIEIEGIKFTNAPDGTYGRSIKYSYCKFVDTEPAPSMSRSFVMDHCTVGTGIPTIGGNEQLDKLVEQYTAIDCTFDTITVSGGSFRNASYIRCIIGRVIGTCRRLSITDSRMQELWLYPPYGATESVTLIGNRVDNLKLTNPAPSGSFVFYNQIVQFFSYSSGVITIPVTSPWKSVVSNGISVWAVPGSKGFIASYEQLTQLKMWDNHGQPFTIFDVFVDGSNNLNIATDLPSLPLGNSTSSVVTLTIGSPTVINWTGHGLTAGTPVVFYTAVASTFPSGTLAEGYPYYVLTAGLTANAFEISSTPGTSGTPVTTSGSMTGTLHCIGNPVVFASHPCPKITVLDCTGDRSLCDMNGQVEQPVFSQVRRAYGGFPLSGGDTQIVLWGNLVTMTVNVLRASSGAGAYTVTFSANGYTSAGAVSNFSQTIDLTVAGLRTITATAATGSAGADSIAAFSGWIGGLVTVFWSQSGNSNIALQPVVELVIQTNQEVIKYGNWQFNNQPSDGNGTQYFSDTSTSGAAS